MATYFLEMYSPCGRYLYSFRSASCNMATLQREARTLLTAEPRGSAVVAMRQDAPFTSPVPVMGWAA